MAKNGSLTIKVSISGLRETLKAFRDLPKDANDELRDGSQKLAQSLVPAVRAAGISEGSQAAAVAPTVKAKRDRVPVIQAGGAKRVTKNRAPAGALVAGSEFGASGRYGWFSEPWFRGSINRQYKPHRGANSYWFFRSVEERAPQIEHAWNDMADRILKKWAD